MSEKPATEIFSDEDSYHFDIADYVVFSSMLLLSALTGLYFGCKFRYNCTNVEGFRGPTLKDYLTGSGSMKPFPVAMSLIASYISGVTILGTPAEIYNFGTQYFLIIVAIWLSGIVVATVYLPVFCKLQVNSSYEYLELRFSKAVRTLAFTFFILDEIMFLPIIIYVPSLAFNQVTGLNLHLIGAAVTLVCVFYTVLGGIKAVVWTDTWQIIIMFLSVVVLVILGTISIGGPDVVFQRNFDGDRMKILNFNPSFYERYTVFSVVIGGFTYWTSFNSVNQTMVQRYLSVPNVKKAQIAVCIFTLGVSVFVAVCCYSGVLVYATYQNCDPLSAGRIKADDQLLPLYVMETVGKLKGVPGLFIAGVFGAALSSLSVVLNSTSTVILEDFLKGCMQYNLSETTSKIIVKVVVLVLGATSVGLVFVVEHMGAILAVATSLTAIAAGTSFGMFSLGMLIPWANSKGAVVGGLCGALAAATVSFGNNYVSGSGLVVPHRLSVSVDDCLRDYGILVNPNSTTVVYPDESDIFPLFKLSYLWITPIGSLTVISVGMIISLLTGKNDTKYTDPDLISPVFQWTLPKQAQRCAGTAIKKLRQRQPTDRVSLARELASTNNSSYSTMCN